jgi:hypothetical protein
MWEHFAHGADIGIRGRGDTRDHAFAEAARGLTAEIRTRADIRAVRCSGSLPHRLLPLTSSMPRVSHQAPTIGSAVISMTISATTRTWTLSLPALIE